MIVAGFIFISPISLTLTREQFYSNGKVAAERIYLIGNTLIFETYYWTCSLLFKFNLVIKWNTTLNNEL